MPLLHWLRSFGPRSGFYQELNEVDDKFDVACDYQVPDSEIHDCSPMLDGAYVIADENDRLVSTYAQQSDLSKYKKLSGAQFKEEVEIKLDCDSYWTYQEFFQEILGKKEFKKWQKKLNPHNQQLLTQSCGIKKNAFIGLENYYCALIREIDGKKNIAMLRERILDLKNNHRVMIICNGMLHQINFSGSNSLADINWHNFLFNNSQQKLLSDQNLVSWGNIQSSLQNGTAINDQDLFFYLNNLRPICLCNALRKIEHDINVFLCDKHILIRDNIDSEIREKFNNHFELYSKLFAKLFTKDVHRNQYQCIYMKIDDCGVVELNALKLHLKLMIEILNQISANIAQIKPSKLHRSTSTNNLLLLAGDTARDSDVNSEDKFDGEHLLTRSSSQISLYDNCSENCSERLYEAAKRLQSYSISSAAKERPLIDL